MNGGDRKIVTSYVRRVMGSPPALFALIVGIVLRILFIVLTPIGGESVPGKLSSYNDELAHANYALHLVHSGTLPLNVESIETPGALQSAQYENYQPPLYYVSIALLARAMSLESREDIVYLGRVFGLGAFALLLLVYLFFCRALAVEHVTAAAGVIFLSLGAVFVRFTATAGNDPLFWILAGLMLIALVRLRSSPFGFRWLAAFVLWSVLALFTKLSALLLVPLLPIALKSESRKRVAILSAAAFAAIILLTWPVWQRNLSEFGSLLPLSAGFGTPHWRIPDFMAFSFAVRSFLFPWTEFWQGAIGLTVLAVPGLFFAFEFFYRGAAKIIISRPLLIGATLLALGGFIWLNLRYDQAEARYVFVVWPVVCLALTAAINAVRRQWLLVAVLVFPYVLFLLPAIGV
ncbi:hypothetical protein KKH27_06565 [bacterium]|nr:hypothetical protein [bacterium]